MVKKGGDKMRAVREKHKLVKRTQYLCLRCDWKWTSSREEPPTVCPNCHSAYWDKPKVNKTPIVRKEGRKDGRQIPTLRRL